MTLRLALAQLNTTVGDVDGNVERILHAWGEAAERGAHLVVFPELAVTGYPPEDLLFRPEFVSASEGSLERLIGEGPRDTAAVVGYVRTAPAIEEGAEWDVAVVGRDDLRNSAAVLRAGEVVGVYDKSRLPNYGVFDEARYFLPGDRPLVVDVTGVSVGVTVCEDLWEEAGPVAAACAAGAELVVNLNASPFQIGKASDRRRWVRHHARSGQVHVCYVNTVGGQDELVFDGDSMVVGPDGDRVASAERFAEDLLVVDLPLGAASELPELPARPPPTELDEVAEVWGAVVLGTRDYCLKNGFEKVVMGLSGGIDSSTTAAVAAAAVGPENVLGVSLPSTYSSEHSRTDAEEVAKRLGIGFETISIEPGREAFDDMLEDLFRGTEPGIAEENIQARTRAVLLMAISNKFGHLLLPTGNKSEASVGYATLYGDMAGGFAPLKDCYKGLVYALARHRNGFPDGPVIPDSVLTKVPSAELRPDQTDQDTLPPYEVLDEILAGYIDENRSVEQIARDTGRDQELVREVARMVDQAEYKRRQAAPGVKISARAFGKDRRVPITSGWRP